jgi:hypothetical protein
MTAILLPGMLCGEPHAGLKTAVLEPGSYRHYFDSFALDEKEMLGTAPSLPWSWFAENIPWLDIPDKEMERIYYFRWYAFQKHIERTPDGFVINEFLDNVNWAGKFNTIDAAAGHHIREARWLRNPEYVDDYTKFWFTPEGDPKRYSFWAADSVYQVALATGNWNLAITLLPSLRNNFEAWESTHEDANGLFWQKDDRDGMEDSISGDGYRPTINSYMYGDALAISKIAEKAGQTQVAQTYRDKADRLRAVIEKRLWNSQDQFYETVARQDKDGWTDDRELIGYIPWYFDIPPLQHDVSWKYLFDPQGFAGHFGPTTAERRNPRFDYKARHECLWNGPSWPFATTQTLVALGNLLNGPKQSVMSETDYFHLLTTYAYSQHIQLQDGRVIPWIDEDLNADTGSWIARSILISLHQLPENRGRYYNHSGFADLIITGLIGLRPTPGDKFTVHPLVPEGKWNYFALDGLPYHGHILTILYDRDGTRYQRGGGLQVLCDGQLIAHAEKLEEIQVTLPTDKSQLILSK